MEWVDFTRGCWVHRSRHVLARTAAPPGGFGCDRFGTRGRGWRGGQRRRRAPQGRRRRRAARGGGGLAPGTRERGRSGDGAGRGQSGRGRALVCVNGGRRPAASATWMAPPAPICLGSMKSCWEGARPTVACARARVCVGGGGGGIALCMEGPRLQCGRHRGVGAVETWNVCRRRRWWAGRERQRLRRRRRRSVTQARRPRPRAPEAWAARPAAAP
jgi:hypothetical protein